ncbi:isochorismatase domain-containing protein 2-like [Dermatophagoides pteronyssinus]|uniref:Isochorismatase domain-containing protein 2, mitochondrial n=1 Tax=Dermatophagoides pteronyssinus TaxID=6956 RepID=A0ABQ8JV37_DERPT|nr:Isochorismatase domain-containing protein 2, mitochondrial [Dermatophagoides pteronyssinus]
MATSNCRNVGKLLQKQSALFICDLQEKFRTNIQYFDAIVQVSSRLLRASRLLDVPVIATEQYPKGLGSTVKELGLDEYPDIKPIAKTQFSMLTTDVIERLKQQHPEVKNIILCGIETHVCVQGTALEAMQAGYDVHIVVDACSSRSMVDRMFAFERMKQAGAWLTTSESVILGLVADASNPKFRDVQKLILQTAPDSGLLSLLANKM